MSERRAAPREIAPTYAALIGGFYLVYGVLALLLTGREIGGTTGNELWVFTVSPLTGIVALAAALIAIPAAASPRAARIYAGAAGTLFLAWTVACLATGDSADPAFAATTANVTLYLVSGLVGVASAWAPAWGGRGMAPSADVDVNEER